MVYFLLGLGVQYIMYRLSSYSSSYVNVMQLFLPRKNTDESHFASAKVQETDYKF